VIEIRAVETEASAPPPPAPVAVAAIPQSAPVEAEVAVRSKWRPPSATVGEAPAKPKAGWWSRKTS